jgi:hypothetical protein
MLRRLKLGGRIEMFETTCCHRSGRLIPIFPIKSREGLLVGASSIARDVTQTHESKRRLSLLMREVNKGLNNRAENSHLPFRKRKRTRQGFRLIG